MIKELIKINKSLNGDCIFVGSVIYYLNDIKLERKIRDIDIIVNDVNKLINLNGNIKDLGYNSIYEAHRYYVEIEGLLPIDIFIMTQKEFVSKDFFNNELKFLSLKQQENNLLGIINNIDREELIKIYEEKLKMLKCVQLELL